MKQILAERLFQHRKRVGLCLQDVKRCTGIAVSTVSSYERGASAPTAPQLIKLANCYGVSTDYLLGLKKRTNNTINTGGLDDQEIALIMEFVQVLLRAKGQPDELEELPRSDIE